MSGDFVFPICSLPAGSPHFFWSQTLCVGLELSWRGNGYTPHLIYFSLLWKELICSSAQIEFSYSWRMTQAEKFPKHLKSENLCLESMRLMVSRWRDRKKRRRRSRGRRREDKRQREGLNSGSLLTALWTRPGLLLALRGCHLTLCQPEEMQRLCTTWWGCSRAC